MQTRPYIIRNPFTTRLLIHRRWNPVRIVGALVSMRTQSGRGNVKLAAESIVYAHFARRVAVLIIANSMVGHPLPSLLATEYHVYMYYYTVNRRRCINISVAVSYPNFVGALAIAPPPPPPPPNKIVWEHMLPLPLPPWFLRLCDSDGSVAVY